MNVLLDDRQLMQLALNEAKYAVECGEVPVGCVIVHKKSDHNVIVLASGSNKTNKTRNGTRHAEMVAIDNILLTQGMNPKIFAECDLYVTCEPCIMCAAALGKVGIRSVYFGCKNDRFGGNGSIMSLHSNCKAGDISPYPIHVGLLEEEAIDIFQQFYALENSRAPVSKRRKKTTGIHGSDTP